MLREICVSVLGSKAKENLTSFLSSRAGPWKTRRLSSHWLGSEKPSLPSPFREWHWERAQQALACEEASGDTGPYGTLSETEDRRPVEISWGQLRGSMRLQGAECLAGLYKGLRRLVEPYEAF